MFKTQPKRLKAWVEKKAGKLPPTQTIKNAEELAEFAKKNKLRKDIDIEAVIKLTNGNRELIESILLSTKEVIEGKSVLELVAYFKIENTPLSNSLSNYQARIWYTWKKQRIGELIDGIVDLEIKAKKAFNLRNAYRNETRKYMKDRKLAEYLSEVERNMTWEEKSARALKKESVNSIEKAYINIIESSKTGRDMVDKLFKIVK